MKTEIYYFSGTGNSLYIARLIADSLENCKLIPMNSKIGEKKFQITADIVGFVFPTYLTSTPAPVIRFFSKMKLTASGYHFAIASFGNYKGLCRYTVEKYLRKNKKNLNSFYHIQMPSNTPTGIAPKAFKGWLDHIQPDIVKKRSEKAEEIIINIIKTIKNKEENLNHSITETFKSFFFNLLAGLIFILTAKTKIPFTVDNTCTGCGICEKICLSGRISIQNQKPVFSDEIQCFFCYACFNACPEQAILVSGKYENKNGRYIHPKISISDISSQNKKR